MGLKLALKSEMALLPQEIEVWYVLPALRRELAAALIVRGLTQKAVAGLLGVTEAAVSQYVHSKRAQKVAFSAEFKKRVNEACGKIESKAWSGYEALQHLAQDFRLTKDLCKLHHELERVPSDCDICLEDFHGHQA